MSQRKKVAVACAGVAAGHGTCLFNVGLGLLWGKLRAGWDFSLLGSGPEGSGTLSYAIRNLR